MRIVFQFADPTGTPWAATGSLKGFSSGNTDLEGAAQISSGSDLSKRIELEGADDEIDTLAKNLDGMFARLEDALKPSDSFTDDASHELRTPTSVIIAQAECGLQSPDLESKQQALVSAAAGRENVEAGQSAVAAVSGGQA